nr:uncharacterized protein c30d11.14c [Quercus suber]
MEYDQQPPKRSRIDVVDPVPVRKSRFDVKSRSRSPTGRGEGENAARRSRSPLKSVDDAASAEKKRLALEKAAAIAAKLKKGPQAADVTPTRKVSSANTLLPHDTALIDERSLLVPTRVPPTLLRTRRTCMSKTVTISKTSRSMTCVTATPSPKAAHRRCQHGSPFALADLGVTSRSKKKLALGPFAHVFEDVTTRGSYYPDKSMATPANPPLYLHVTSTTKDGLEHAVRKIEELMTQELPNLVDERRFGRRPPREEGPPVERDSYGRRKWPEEHIPIDLEPIPGFNLRAQVVGSGGSYVKYIQGETRCRVQIKGRGSGYFEHETGVESDEPMYLSIA